MKRITSIEDFMRFVSSRVLPALALVAAAAAAAPLAAQACLGYASFASNHLQMNAGATVSSDVEQFGANFVSGSNSIFAGLGVGGTRYSGSDASLEARGTLGSQVPVSASGKLQACPVITAMYGTGPDGLAGPGSELTSMGAGFGLAFGGELSRSTSLAIVPSLQLGFQFERLTVDGVAGETTTDTYGTIGAAVGFVFTDQLSLRPSMMIPTREGSNEPIFGISVALNYGRRR